MLITIPLGPIQANCYIMSDDASGTGCVIDPGWDGDRIIERVRKEGITVSHIILTHGHFDHALGAGQVKEATGAPLLIHSEDAAMYESGGSARSFGIRVPPLPAPDAFLADGETIMVGGLAVKVLHTPGHSPGSVSLYVPDREILFTGDLLFAMGIGRTDLEGGDTETLFRSLDEKVFTLPDSTTVYPGHGPKTTIGAEKSGNPWLRG